MAIAVRAGRPQAFGRAGKAPTLVRTVPSAAGTAATPTEAAPVAPTASGFHVGFLTLGLMAVMIVIFVYELRLSGSSGSEVNGHYFVALGGESWKLIVQQHEWWRFFTAAWLHADSSHIIGNGVVLVLAGWRLERFIGRAWLLAAYIVGAIGGGIGSLLLAPPGMLVSVGASGAISAMVALLFTISFHASVPEKTAARFRRYAVFMLIPALAPSIGDDSGINVGCHFGGAVAGTAFGFLMLALWPEERNEKPPFRWAAAGVGIAGLAVTALAFVAVWQHMPAYADEARQFAPPVLLRDAEKNNTTAELAAAYPHDPFVRLVRAVHLYAVHDMTGALGEIRAGLAEKRALTEYSPEITFHLRLMLVLGLMVEERADDARNEAQSICPIVRDPNRWPIHGRGERSDKLAEVIALVRDNHICD